MSIKEKSHFLLISSHWSILSIRHSNHSKTSHLLQSDEPLTPSTYHTHLSTHSVQYDNKRSRAQLPHSRVRNFPKKGFQTDIEQNLKDSEEESRSKVMDVSCRPKKG